MCFLREKGPAGNGGTREAAANFEFRPDWIPASAGTTEG